MTGVSLCIFYVHLYDLIIPWKLEAVQPVDFVAQSFIGFYRL